MIIGMIGALDEELTPIRNFIKNLERLEKGGRTYWHGAAHGHQIYLTRCDLGKVNAAIAAQHLIDHFGPQAVFNMGSAGGLAPHLQVGDLVIASELIQHDFDVTDWGLKPGEIIFDLMLFGNEGQLQFREQQIFNTHPALQNLAQECARALQLDAVGGRTPSIHSGRILSGDQFISKLEKAKGLWDTYQGLCTDMEAAAIAHTCEVNHVPFLCIRAISDKADHTAVVSFTDFLAAATSNYGRIFDRILQQAGDAISP